MGRHTYTQDHSYLMSERSRHSGSDILVQVPLALGVGPYILSSHCSRTLLLLLLLLMMLLLPTCIVVRALPLQQLLLLPHHLFHHPPHPELLHLLGVHHLDELLRAEVLLLRLLWAMSISLDSTVSLINFDRFSLMIILHQVHFAPLKSRLEVDPSPAGLGPVMGRL